MTDVEFESEAFLKLLTDALRSGPGSPEWREATRRLREEGIEHADEYQMLVTAREHLESGKEYRSVSAGPEFTRRLMDELEREPAQATAAGQPPTAMLIAFGCAAAMLIIVLSIGYLLWQASDQTGGPSLLVNTVTTVDLTGKPNPEWRTIGSLPIVTSRGALRVVLSSDPGASGGGLVWNKPIPPDEPFAVQVTLRAPRPQANMMAQVFITDDPAFSDDRGTSKHELVWLLQSKQAQVILPTQRVEAQSDAVLDSRNNVTIRITLDGPEATVELNRAAWWSGEHLLDPAKPRYVGVRYLRSGGPVEDGVYFSNIRVNMRQP